MRIVSINEHEEVKKSMRSHVIKKLILILTAVVIISSIPTLAIAVDNDPGSREREILSQNRRALTSEEVLAKDLEKALKLLEIAKQENKKQIAAAMNRLGGEKTRTSTVTLGTDKTFTDADTWDKDRSWSGVCVPRVVDSDYDYKWAWGTCLLGPGVGWGAAWAYSGKEFYVSGEGSQSANIIIDGIYDGLTMAAGTCSADTDITFHIYDTTTSADYSTTIYSQSTGVAGYYDVDEDFRKGKSVTLQAGHTYVAFILLETAASMAGVGVSSSDFGPFDGDDGEVWYYSIEIDF